MKSFEIGGFECSTLRDAMHIAAQFNRTAMVRLDAEGLHISTTNEGNAAAVWIDMPPQLFKRDWHNIPPELDEMGVNCNKLYRMLHAYESEDYIEFSVVSIGDAHFSKLRGNCGNLETCLIAKGHYHSAHPIAEADHPTYVACKSSADVFRDWVVHDAMDRNTVAFTHQAAKTILEVQEEPDHRVLRLRDPELVKSAPEEFSTNITVELLHAAIAPVCMEDDLTIRFGDDEILHINTNVGGCTVEIVIAPRIGCE